jgi:hypothetical protein
MAVPWSLFCGISSVTAKLGSGVTLNYGCSSAVSSLVEVLKYMRLGIGNTMRLVSVTIILLYATFTASAATPVRHKVLPRNHATISHTRSTARRVSTRSISCAKSGKRGKTAAARPVVAMDTERATQIQTALIKSGYLSGQATGSWDAQSIAAMQKLQSDNGWQTKIVPDSRALIKLGLGPNSTPN